MGYVIPQYVIEWTDLQTLVARDYQCGHCNRQVSSDQGYLAKLRKRGDRYPDYYAAVYVCPGCHHPTYISPDFGQIPGVPMGASVQDVPKPLNALYEEARRCTTARCYTAAAMLCRKILMHVAVADGAAEGLGFDKYVSYLGEHNLVPASGKQWLDHIRVKGNQANHQIESTTAQEAEQLLVFSQMLLQLVYEFPARLK